MLDIIEKVDDELLDDNGLELIKQYGFFMDEEEKLYFNENIDRIETDSLGFGNYYAMALKYVKESLKGQHKIVDIGCAWGLFSYMFREL
jgi:cyclopropane fatty-acyl-phospholipid synthase-like methyltransferase